MDIGGELCAICSQKFGEDVSAIQFGNIYIHSDTACFSCSKCKILLNIENSTILADDRGFPLCQNCGFKCAVCRNPILEEAIQAGEGPDSIFHAGCFKCCMCASKIEDLVFVRSDDKIFCSACSEKKERSLSPKRPLASLNVGNSFASTTLAGTDSSFLFQKDKEPANGSVKLRKAATDFSAGNELKDILAKRRTSSSASRDSSISEVRGSPPKATPPLKREYSNSVSKGSADMNLEARLARMRARADGGSDAASTPMPPNQPPIMTTSQKLAESPLSSADSPSRAAFEMFGRVREASPSEKVFTSEKVISMEKGGYKSKDVDLDVRLQKMRARADGLTQCPTMTAAIPGNDLLSQFLPLTNQNSAAALVKKENLKEPVIERSLSSDTKNKDEIFKLQQQKNALQTQVMELLKQVELVKLDAKLTTAPLIAEVELMKAKFEELRSINAKYLLETLGLKEEIQKITSSKPPSPPPRNVLKEGEIADAALELARLKQEAQKQRALLDETRNEAASELHRVKQEVEINQKLIGEMQEAKFTLAGFMEQLTSEKVALEADVNERNEFLTQVFAELQSIQLEVEEGENLRKKLFEDVTILRAEIEDLAATKREMSKQPTFANSLKDNIDSLTEMASSSAGKCQLEVHPRDLSPPSATANTHGKGYQRMEEDVREEDVKKSGFGKLRDKIGDARGRKKTLSSTDGLNEKAEEKDKDKDKDKGQVGHAKSISVFKASMRQVMPGKSKTAHPASSTAKIIFGAALEDICSESNPVPDIVKICINAVEKRGMEYEGIYRKSGPSSLIIRIAASFAKGDLPDLCDEDEWNDVTAVTSALKKFFMEMKDCLLTTDLYDWWVEIGRRHDDEEKFYEMRRLIYALPIPNRATLAHLMLHLHRVFQRNEVNKMTASNLGVVWGPSLLKTRETEVQLMMVDSGVKIQLIEYMVQYAQNLFDDVMENLNHGQTTDPFQ